jgi:hypothetical protein
LLRERKVLEMDYYKKLVTLYEFTTKEEKSDGTNKTQDKISNTGSDLNQSIDDPALAEDGLGFETDEMSGLDDADYLSSDEEDEVGLSPMMDDEVIEVSDKQKLLKLFDLFKELVDYSQMFYDSLNTVDFNLLEKDKFTKLRETRTKLFTLIEKLENYINEVFYGEKYEKALYVYILLRTELLTNIKLLREILELNKEETKKEPE